MKRTALVVSLFLLVGTASANELQKPPPDNGLVCPTDTQLCPDGSYISRTGPNCSWAPCPGIRLDDNENPKPIVAPATGGPNQSR